MPAAGPLVTAATMSLRKIGLRVMRLVRLTRVIRDIGVSRAGRVVIGLWV